AHHAASDFAAVGDQQGGQHCRGSCVAWEVVPPTLAPSPGGGGAGGVGPGNGGDSKHMDGQAGPCGVGFVARTLHEATPSPLWGEGWGEGANGQPTSTIRHLPASAACASPERLPAPPGPRG